LRIIRDILTIITVILAVIILIGNIDRRMIMPYMFTCIGIQLIFNGMHFYKQGKKTDGILLFLTSIFIWVVVVILVIS
jgi:heme/copper-type cytochrome/quinol oxidase subunit 4